MQNQLNPTGADVVEKHNEILQPPPQPIDRPAHDDIDVTASYGPVQLIKPWPPIPFDPLMPLSR